MIGIFKNNLFFNSLLLLPYVILLRIHSLLYPVAYEISESDTLLTKLIFGFVESALLQNVIAIGLVYYHVLYINRLVIKHRLALQITLLPGLIYSILVSFLPDYSMLSPYLIANTFVLFCVSQIFKTYKKPKAADLLFNIGFYIALSFLFVPNYILLILLGIIGLFVMRSAKLIETLQIMSGVLLVVLAFCSILFLFNLPFLPEILKADLTPKLTIMSLKGESLYNLVVIFVVALFAVFSYNRYTIKKSIQVQKKIDIFYWLMITSFLFLILANPIDANLFLLLCIPLAVFLNLNFNSIKGILVQEIIHISALVLLFIHNFGLL